MSKLQNKVAVVTGASKGIGAAIARSLAASGASVVVNYASSKAGADKVVAEIEAAGGKAIAVGGDVSKKADAEALVEAAVKTFGRLDVVVNNSGVYEFRPLDDIDDAHYERMFDINVRGVIYVTQAASKHLGEGGSIVNIGSGVSRITPATSLVYTATKGALDAITGVLSQELGPRGIRVNSVNPGMVRTEGTDTAGFTGTESASDFEKSMTEKTPLGRIGQPDDIASVVTFLASDDARWLSGELLLTAGGLR